MRKVSEKALDILLECEKSTEGIKKVFFQKTLKNTLMKIKKVFY